MRLATRPGLAASQTSQLPAAILGLSRPNRFGPVLRGLSAAECASETYLPWIDPRVGSRAVPRTERWHPSRVRAARPRPAANLGGSCPARTASSAVTRCTPAVPPSVPSAGSAVAVRAGGHLLRTGCRSTTAASARPDNRVGAASGARLAPAPRPAPSTSPSQAPRPSRSAPCRQVRSEVLEGVDRHPSLLSECRRNLTSEMNPPLRAQHSLSYLTAMTFAAPPEYLGPGTKAP